MHRMQGSTRHTSPTSAYTFMSADFSSGSYGGDCYEWLDWYVTTPTSSLINRCREFMLDASEDLYQLYPDSFDSGYYAHAENRLNSSEVQLFRDAADVPAEYNGRISNDEFDVYEGLVAVLKSRLAGNSSTCGCPMAPRSSS